MTLLGHRNLLRFMAHGLEVARESVVEATGARTDVHDLARLRVSNHVDAGPALQCADPVRVTIAADADRAIREAGVAGDELGRIRHGLPGAHDRRGIDRVIRTAEPQLEMEVLEVLRIERV